MYTVATDSIVALNSTTEVYWNAILHGIFLRGTVITQMMDVTDNLQTTVLKTYYAKFLPNVI